MAEITHRNRRAHRIENRHLRVTVTIEGGHIAEIFHKTSGVNPLWTPPWPSIEPSTYDRQRHPEYGADAESKLLSGILGHNLCLDLFGAPSDEEAAAGITVHGEASIVPYQVASEDDRLTMKSMLPAAQLRFERSVVISESQALLTETVENLSPLDRPIAWTEHATLGPPFLEKGQTQFRAPATRSKVIENDFTGGKGYMKTAAQFDWPMVPHKDGGTVDLRVYTDTPVSGGFTTHLMDTQRETAWFVAWSPKSKLAFGYAWKRSDFPWLGIWEENYSRDFAPWNGKTLTRGMEFGASPFPESRRKMIERGSLFGMPAYRWLPARSRATVRYCAFALQTDRIPEAIEWDGAGGIRTLY